jgi:hypothetical protein
VGYRGEGDTIFVFPVIFSYLGRFLCRRQDGPVHGSKVISLRISLVQSQTGYIPRKRLRARCKKRELANDARDIWRLIFTYGS